MTVAQVKEAARLLEEYADSYICNLSEIGSEGCLLYIGSWIGVKLDREVFLITRDGKSRKWRA